MDVLKWQDFAHAARQLPTRIVSRASGRGGVIDCIVAHDAAFYACADVGVVTCGVETGAGVGVQNDMGHLEALGSAGYALALHLVQGLPRACRFTYPATWIEHYTRHVYQMHDPVVLWGVANSGALRWADIPLPDPCNVLGQAAEFGLRHGVVVSCGPPHARSIAGIARPQSPFTDAEISELAECITRLHRCAAPGAAMSKGQMEALRMYANGNQTKEIGQKLGISASAVKERLVAARRRMEARTLEEAVYTAKTLGFF